MKKILAFACLLIPCLVLAQTQTEKPRILYGTTKTDSLLIDPFGKWYQPNFDGYHTRPLVLDDLKKLDWGNISIQVFFGTWCGDSKREVPRFLKLMQELNFPLKKIELVALGGGDSLVKQSPQHEEKGKGIFRVPTFIIYKNGRELGRINEFPVNSLEKDLLAIVKGDSYSPNYRSFAFISRWMADGTIQDENISQYSLAEQLRPLDIAEFELNSLGHLLLKQGFKKDALRVFQVNAVLFPESSNVLSSLGEGYMETGDKTRAISNLERSLEFVKKPTDIKPILELLYKAKESGK